MHGTKEYIDIKKLFEYAEDNVPKLAEHIGGVQEPFSRGINEKGSFDIGRMEQEDKEKIVISEPKPVFVKSLVAPIGIKTQDLGIDKLIDGKLMDLSAKGYNAPFIFSKGDYPEAYRIRGEYKTENNKILIEMILEVKENGDFHYFGDSFVVEGDKIYLENLVEEIIDKVNKMLKIGCMHRSL